MKRVLRTALLAAAAAGAFASRAAAQDAPERAPPRKLAAAYTVATDFAVATHRLLDVDGDGTDDLLVVGRHGEVRVWRNDPAKDRLAESPSGVLVLPEPERAVLAVADVLGRGGPPQLCVLSRRGLEAYPVGADGAYQRAPVLVSPQTTFGLRVGEPTFADVLRDVNGDGRPDLILPRGDACEIWLHAGAAEGAASPQLRSVGAFKVDVTRERATDAGALSDVLESSFRIPPLAFRDVNGDGRSDLFVEDGKTRSFHLARPDGTFATEPDVRVDLAKFEDTTPEAEVKLGRTLAGGDDQRFESTDLDGDGIPDYVISHRRKVWVFRGGKDGPQFTEPSQVLRVADDVSAMLVARLDGEARPDLLLLRVQVPTVATILRGLVATWDVEIGAVGYENAGEGKFSTAPKWKHDLALRLPAILGILKDPEAIMQRFEGLATRLRRGFVWGDFDGDGRDDAAVVANDAPANGGTNGREERGHRMDVWFGLGRDAAGGDDVELGSIFFGDQDVWDVDRILAWLGDYADRRFARVTQGREPTQRIALRAGGEAELIGVGAARFDGGARSQVVVAWMDEKGRGLFDVWR